MIDQNAALISREIRDTVERYFAAMDGRKFEMLRDVFTPDATGFWFNELSGVDNIIARISNVSRFKSSTHVAGNSVVRLEGHLHASVVTEAVAYLEVSGLRPYIIVRGISYTDDFVFLADVGWRISRRIHDPKWQYSCLAEVPSLPPRLPGPNVDDGFMDRDRED